MTSERRRGLGAVTWFVAHRDMAVAALMVCAFGLSSLVLLDRLGAAHSHLAHPGLPSPPSASAVLALARSMDESLGVSRAEDLDLVEPYLRSGVVGFYSLIGDAEVVGYLAVLRYDIYCTVCRDLLVVVLLDAGMQNIAGVMPVEPWEINGIPYNPTSHLAQLLGKDIASISSWSQAIDVVSGATKSCHALMVILSELAVFVAETRG